MAEDIQKEECLKEAIAFCVGRFFHRARTRHVHYHIWRFIRDDVYFSMFSYTEKAHIFIESIKICEDEMWEWIVERNRNNTSGVLTW